MIPRAQFLYQFPRIRGSAARFLSLLISGVLSSLFLVLLASQRIFWVPESTVIFLLTFLQWYALGLTIAKVGIDQVAFALQSQDVSIRFDIVKFCVRRAAPLALVASIVMGLLFSSGVAAVAFVVILFDVYTLTATAELNARKNFLPAIVGNFLNYPLFLSAGIIGSIYFDSRVVFLSAFIGSTIMRALWVHTQHERISSVSIVDFTAATEMMVQQILNFLLFRVDQLLLPSLLIMGLISTERSAQLVYLFKYPELVSTLVLMAGIFVFPLFLPDTNWRAKRFKFEIHWKHVAIASCSTVIVVVSYVIYVFTWSGSEVAIMTYGLFYLINAVLVFPVNALIYLHLGKGHSFELIRNSLISVLGGLGSLLALYFFDRLELIGLVVPCQLLLMLLLTFIIPLRAPRPLYSTG